jgi:hypothetical protein
MRVIDPTTFLRIQTPIMILANIILFVVLLFTTPDWVFGIKNLYPPYAPVSVASALLTGNEVGCGKHPTC